MEQQVREWCTKQRVLLLREIECMRKDNIHNLSLRGEIDQIENKACGKAVVTFSLLKGGQAYNRFKERCLVEVSEIQDVSHTSRNGPRPVQGTLVSKDVDTFSVSFKSDFWGKSRGVGTEMTVRPCENEVSFKRIFDSISMIEDLVDDVRLNSRALTVFRLMFEDSPKGLLEVQSVRSALTDPEDPLARRVNQSQGRAVQASLDTSTFHMIHGPPGTGKTTTICELVLQLIKNHKRVLLCAPSNYAVDNMTVKLCRSSSLPKGTDLLRFGDGDRMNPSLHAFSFEERLRHSEEYALITEIDKEIKSAERVKRFQELRRLYKERKSRLYSLKSVCIARSHIIACTLNSAGHNLLHDETFDVCIVDEAGQALAIESWIALSKASKIILVGDPMQLPPTSVSNQKALEVSLMETLLAKHRADPKHVTLLDVQYRMHESIARWSSMEFYDGKVRCGAEVSTKLLADIDGVSDTYETSQAVMFFDTSAYGFSESAGRSKMSKMNNGEADIVVLHIQKLTEAGLSLDSIGVITPYSAQAACIVEALRGARLEHQRVEVNTVDAFQGREKLAIIISLVRNNEEQEIGFLQECRRMNVAFTRARRHLVIVGDLKTSASNDFMKRLWHYVEENGAFLDIDD